MAVFFVSSISNAACPRFPFPKTPDQVWQNDQDLDDCISNLSQYVSTTSVSVSSAVAGGSTNYIQNTANPTTTTQIFNVSSGTAKELISSTITATLVTGSSITYTNATIANLKISTAQWQGFGLLPILQVQYFHTETSSNTTNTAFVNTTLSGSFTPKLSTSKVLLYATGILSQNVGDGGYMTFARNGTNLSPNTGGFMGTVSNTNYNFSAIYYDSPATTSAVTYSVQFRTAAGGATIVFPVINGGIIPSAGLLAIEVGQ